MACAPTPCPPFELPPPVVEVLVEAPAPVSDPSWPAAPSNAYCGAPTKYYSSRVTYSNTCAEIDDPQPHFTITVSIPAYTFSSYISQFDADQQALASAEAQADALRLLYPCVPSAELLSTELLDTIVTEVGDGISLS